MPLHPQCAGRQIVGSRNARIMAVSIASRIGARICSPCDCSRRGAPAGRTQESTQKQREAGGRWEKRERQGKEVCACMASALALTIKTPHCGHCPASRSRHHRTNDCAETSSHIEPGCHAALQSKQTLSPQSGQTQRLHGPNRLRPCHRAMRRPRAPHAAAMHASRCVSPKYSDTSGATTGTAALAAQPRRPIAAVRYEKGRSSIGGLQIAPQPWRTHQRVRGSRSAFSAATIASYRSSCDGGSTLATSCRVT